MISVKGYAARSDTSPLAPFAFERRELRPKDVLIEILYCGICHSDLHLVRNEWGRSIYPIVPGHEIVGRVIRRANAREDLGKATLQQSAVSSIPAANVPTVKAACNNIARADSF